MDEHALRKAMRDEASGIDGLGTQVPSPFRVWRYPFFPVHDIGYEEDE